MAITYIGSASNAFSNAVSGSFTLPVGWADGDLGVFWWWTRSSTIRVFTKPTDVDQKLLYNGSSDVFGQLWIGYRHLVTGDTTFDWTCTSVANQTIVFGSSVFRGTVASGDPFEATSGSTAQESNVTDVDPPSVDVLSSGACVIVFNGKTLQTAVAAYSSGYADAGGISTSLGNDGSGYMEYQVIAAPGTEDPGIWDFTQSVASGNLTWTAAIAPPGAAGPALAAGIRAL